VNNLPKVVNLQQNGPKLNSQPVRCKCLNDYTTRPTNQEHSIFKLERSVHQSINQSYHSHCTTTTSCCSKPCSVVSNRNLFHTTSSQQQNLFSLRLTTNLADLHNNTTATSPLWELVCHMGSHSVICNW